MDKTIEIMLVAVVAIIVALTVVSLVQGQSSSFTGFIGGQTDNAECQVWQTKVQNCNADSVPTETGSCDVGTEPDSCS